MLSWSGLINDRLCELGQTVLCDVGLAKDVFASIDLLVGHVSGFEASFLGRDIVPLMRAHEPALGSIGARLFEQELVLRYCGEPSASMTRLNASKAAHDFGAGFRHFDLIAANDVLVELSVCKDVLAVMHLNIAEKAFGRLGGTVRNGVDLVASFPQGVEGVSQTRAGMQLLQLGEDLLSLLFGKRCLSGDGGILWSRIEGHRKGAVQSGCKDLSDWRVLVADAEIREVALDLVEPEGSSSSLISRNRLLKHVPGHHDMRGSCPCCLDLVSELSLERFDDIAEA